jgi:glycosyltransferase involved in cell wall biosynthesis
MKDFEWIVIDDDSNDETESLVKKWIEEKPEFDIIYKKQKRGGKHSAHNKAVRMARGGGFVVIDDDDYPVDDALEMIEIYFNDIKDKPYIASLAVLRGESETQPIAGMWGSFNGEYIDLPDFNRIEKTYSISTDKTPIYKTEILKKYPFPEYEGEYSCYPESIVHVRMAMDGYMTRFINKILVICRYLPDGITMSNIETLYSTCPNNYLEYISAHESCGDFLYEEAEKRRYLIYENVRISSGKERADEILKKYSNNVESYEDIFLHITENLDAYFDENGLKKIAVYGYGRFGKLFLRLSEHLNIKVDYIIDANEKCDAPVCIYRPEDDLPKVDAILVCINQKMPEVDAALAGRRFVWWRDIEKNYWEWI